MHFWVGFVYGLFGGSVTGILIMALMNAASQADNNMIGDKQYDEH